MSFRLVLIIVSIGIVCYLGAFVSGFFPPLTGTTAFVPLAITAVASFMIGCAALLLSIPTAMKFVRCGDEHFTDTLVALAPALLCFLLASTIGTTLIRSSMSQGPASTSSEGPLQITFKQGGSHEAILVPFFPIEGKSNRCDVNQTDFGSAANLTNPQIKSAVSDLMNSLRSCSSKLGGTVRIDVRGFASSSEFRGCSRHVDNDPAKPTISEQLNWRLGEARRQAVIGLIQSVTQPSSRDQRPPITIFPDANAPRFSGPQEMRENMHFADRTDQGGYDPSKAALTRRAEVVILDKAACEPH